MCFCIFFLRVVSCCIARCDFPCPPGYSLKCCWAICAHSCRDVASDVNFCICCRRLRCSAHSFCRNVMVFRAYGCSILRIFHPVAVCLIMCITRSLLIHDAVLCCWGMLCVSCFRGL